MTLLYCIMVIPLHPMHTIFSPHAHYLPVTHACMHSSLVIIMGVETEIREGGGWEGALTFNGHTYLFTPHYLPGAHTCTPISLVIIMGVGT